MYVCTDPLLQICRGNERNQREVRMQLLFYENIKAHGTIYVSTQTTSLQMPENSSWLYDFQQPRCNFVLSFPSSLPTPSGSFHAGSLVKYTGNSTITNVY